MRKILICLLAMCMLMLTACNDTASQVNDNTGAQESATVSEEEDAISEAEDTGDWAADNGKDSELMDMKVADLDEKDVRLGDLISANDLTLINYWGTFCGPCIREMPDLGVLSHEYSDQGFGIVGLTCDIVNPADGSYDAGSISDAKDIIDSTGADYPIVIATNELNDYINSDVVPISFFVDKHGNQIGEIIPGSRSYEAWDEVISSALTEIGQ